MPNCTAMSYTGNICNHKSNELHYFWYHDPFGRVSSIFYICVKHSNQIINELMEKENGYANLIKICYDQIAKKRETLMIGGSLSEQREKRKQARDNGLPEPKFKSVQELKNEVKALYEKISNARKILVIERNKVCRYCKYPLKEPESQKDQIGLKYTIADFKSPVGFRRLDAIFHTECGIAWITNKMKIKPETMRHVQPKRTGQQTIFSYVEDLIN